MLKRIENKVIETYGFENKITVIVFKATHTIRTTISKIQDYFARG